MTIRPLLFTVAIAVPLLASPRSDYEALQQWQFEKEGAPIARPVSLQRGPATWTLQSGRVRLMKPLPTERVTGLIFEGEGQFTLAVSDRTERRQLRRFTSRPDLESIDTSFTEMVFRTSDDAIEKAFPAEVGAQAYAGNALATDRHNHWLIDYRFDVDAEVIAAMVNPLALATVAAVKTREFGWLDFIYDSTAPEKAQLIRWTREYPEVWLSLEPQSPLDTRPARLDAIDVHADLTHYSFTPTAGVTHQKKMNGHFVVEETLTPMSDGVSALRMQLDATAHDVMARDATGAAIDVIRDHIGARRASVDNKYYDPQTTLLFAQPLQKGVPQRVTFEYDLETENYVKGRSWYPTFAGYYDPHTARLELLVNRHAEVRSMGTLQSETEDIVKKRSVWIVSRPTVMVTFSTAERLEEATAELPGVPPITSFGEVAHLNPGTRIRKAAEDVAKAIQFYQTILDDKLDTPHLFVTSITGEHGQAFDGFLHLSERSYANEPGAEELFRGHETAHSWFGHKVGWKSYRDQWLTESIAEYLGMMFVEARVDHGEDLFQQILFAYQGIVKGDLSGGFSKFSRPWLVNALRNSAYRARLGPIGHGYRAGTGDIPFGYMVQTYYKGPLVVHMLRMLLRYQSGSDDLFVRVLRDFVHQYSGKQASTDDLQHVIERDAGGDWTWFFDQWIRSAEIPTVHCRSAVDSGTVRITLKRSTDLPLLVPVRIDFDDGSSTVRVFALHEVEESFTEQVHGRARKVVCGPDHSLLANITK